MRRTRMARSRRSRTVRGPCFLTVARSANEGSTAFTVELHVQQRYQYYQQYHRHRHHQGLFSAGILPVNPPAGANMYAATQATSISWTSGRCPSVSRRLTAS
jgi:hypothetical protein